MHLDLINTYILSEDIEKKRPYLLKKLQDNLETRLLKGGLRDQMLNELINFAVRADPIANKSGGKKTPFVNKILDWYIAGTIELPPDIETVRDVLAKYNDLYSHGKLKKKIDEYYSPGDLRADIDEISETREEGFYDYLELIESIPGFTMYRIDTFEQGEKAFKDSGWCVQHKIHFDNYGPPYFMIITDKNKRYALLHGESHQIKDVHDRPLILELAKPIEKLIKLVWKEYEFKDDLKRLINLWPDAKNDLMKDPRSAYIYIKEVLHERWPEAEPYIVKDPFLCTQYAICFIRDRWPEAEFYILKSCKQSTIPDGYKIFDTAFDYTNRVLKQNRWPELEEIILESKDPRLIFEYARSGIHKRWREAESILMKSPQYAHYYAVNVMHGPWKEAEPYIFKNEQWGKNYKNSFDIK